MAELKGYKRRLSINLSFLTSNDQTQMNNNNNSSTKSSKKFEGGANGVVGLGIVAAMNELDQTQDPYFTAKSSRAAVSAVSPRSSPIPIFSNISSSVSVYAKSGTKLGSDLEEMECSEEYTCVISHIGNNLIKKKEYFDGNLSKKSESTVKASSYWVSSGVFSAFSPPAVTHGDEKAAKPVFETEDFLSSCYLCKKKLHGLDIFMYRGEKAFCSAECRHKQISTDEHKDKCGSGAMKSHEYSVSPCSGPMQFLAGVAAA